ncbi:hypothetical protein CERSUDRAFT_82356 [Gelatoporia subvermispora B]|uniref:RING-type E3 ubiquitin transferase n=1 Tax=Ceriporiopsis subvermispora (strain B) TaxID=914234 RepID=M2RH28_CERS8|nr:hypothetical protein CERSUDRAFT_82356 [Gelatoporia subvermispora B]
MATGTTTQTRAAGQAQRGRSRRGNKGRGAGAGAQSRNEGSKDPNAANADQKQGQVAVEDMEDASKASEADDGNLCWICAEPVKYWSVSECNHRTCHVCALRLRALYKKLECTFCKESQPSVIFTSSPDALWSSYTPDTIPYKDPKLSISFETQEMMEETLILLRFNCPDSNCDYIGNGWSDLKLHTRATHGKLMCDLCIKVKKVFAHEHALYPPNILPHHLPSMLRSQSSKPKEQIEGGVHPLCEFCKECFFGDDELYAHMRERHEDCFICKRNEVRDQYFRDYNALEQHFMHAHHPCTQSQCLARKFVVFGSPIDLKAHMVEEHGAEMSSRDKKDVRRVQAEFEFEEVGGGHRRGRRDRGDRERDRDPPPHVAAPPGPSRAATAGSRRREAFGGNLTAEGPTTPAAATPNLSRGPSRRQSPSPEGDPSFAERQAALMMRLNSLAPNPAAAAAAVNAAVRSYRSSESAARDLILTVWNILDRNLDGSASIVNVLVDLVDEDDKKRDLLAAWNGFKVEQRGQFPELVPTTTGTGWSGIASGRVLNAKQSTFARNSTQSSRQVLDRVARAAASSSPGPSTPPVRAQERFPPLQSTASSSASPAFRQSQRATPWASTASAPTVVRGPTSVPGPAVAQRRASPAPVLTSAAFPELPSAAPIRAPRAAIGGNKSLQNILGSAAPAMPAWQSSNGGEGNEAPAPGDGQGEQEATRVFPDVMIETCIRIGMM